MLEFRGFSDVGIHSLEYLLSYESYFALCLIDQSALRLVLKVLFMSFSEVKDYFLLMASILSSSPNDVASDLAV